MTPKPWYWIAPEPDKDGNRFGVSRLRGRRIRMWIEADKSVSISFDRPAQEGDKPAEPHVLCNGRITRHRISMSDEAMRSVVALWLSMQDRPVELPFLHNTENQ